MKNSKKKIISHKLSNTLICKKNFFSKLIKISIAINLYISLLELFPYIFIFENGIQLVATTSIPFNKTELFNNENNNNSINIQEELSKNKEVQSNAIFSNNNSSNQRNVTIGIPTYESDVSEPQFQFNLISPSPNETWTIGKL